MIEIVRTLFISAEPQPFILTQNLGTDWTLRRTGLASGLGARFHGFPYLNRSER